ncbi:DUF6477 family protein [Pseudaestuariivita atlantica]|uniref:Uncharacterized protein n=1 Tax=Pseudaestuariivita atlantica TaxID=1317121 RepID=A0A0L1JMS0_9RHOB|nr:DUF6477 family protein [Pseudaestuariivita atlantica]KNG93051.1 hypothetical protein ATO11_14115 [Pseudaestuariivita atlantica]
MQDLTTMLRSLKRPRLLIRAARLGVDSYRRGPHLRRILRTAAPPRAGAALLALIEIEAELETQRTEQMASYSITRHVDVLIALMGEAQLARAR